MDELAGITLGIVCAQPWGSITAEGPRDVHNLVARPASTILGQRVAIYASAKPDLETAAQAMELLASLGMGPTKSAPWSTRKVFGAVIGTAMVTGIVSEHESPWFVGPFALVLTKRAPLKAPVSVIPKSVQAGGIWRIA
jgi:hypothetical protein